MILCKETHDRDSHRTAAHQLIIGGQEIDWAFEQITKVIQRH